MRIDHAIIGARDIGAVADRLWERHGLASLPGGRHPGWGTHNRIVPLGGPYLEIIGVADENEALRDPMGRWLLANTATGDPLMALVLRDRRHRAARRAGSASRSSAAAASGPTARASPGASPGATRRSARGRSSSPGTSRTCGPGLLSAPHAVEVRGISQRRGRLRRRRADGWVDADVPVRPLGGGGGLRAIVIATADGEIRLTGDS